MSQEVTETGAYEQSVRQLIESATLSVGFFVLAPTAVNSLRALLRQAKAGVAVDVIVPEDYLHKVGLTDRYRQRLVEAGGRFFLVNLQPKDWQRIKISPRSILLLDHRMAWQPTGDPKLWRPSETSLETIRKQFDLLRTTGTIPDTAQPRNSNITGWRTTDTALKVLFSSDTTLVKAGGQVRLHWSIPGATEVDIQPHVGRVHNFGSRRISLNEPTEFTLTAVRHNVRVAKVLKIEMDRRLSLDYYLTANDPLGLRSPSRLVGQPDLPGFFGVLQGVPLTLHWQAMNAKSMSFQGGQVADAGEYSFTPAKKTYLHLKVLGVQGEEKAVTLTIQPFQANIEVPPELLAPATPALPEIRRPVISATTAPDLTADLLEDPLEKVDEKTLRALRQEWKAKNKRGVLHSLRNWIKRAGK